MSALPDHLHSMRHCVITGSCVMAVDMCGDSYDEGSPSQHHNSGGTLYVNPVLRVTLLVCGAYFSVAAVNKCLLVV